MAELTERLKRKLAEKYRYIGNAGPKKEFHSIRRMKPGCQVDEIKQEALFKTGREAKDAGYDACGKCSVYWRSKR